VLFDEFSDPEAFVQPPRHGHAAVRADPIKLLCQLELARFDAFMGPSSETAKGVVFRRGAYTLARSCALEGARWRSMRWVRKAALC
jgi:hypothetical protein